MKTTTVTIQMDQAVGRYGNERADSGRVLANDVATRIGLFPHGQARTRGAPSVDDFGIRPISWPDPLKKIDHQCVNGI
jgi:hypothetical protein